MTMEECKTVIFGPWGGEGGKQWNYPMKGEVSNIFMTFDSNGVNSIRFTSKDERGKTYRSNLYGSASGTQKEIKIDSQVEKLISMEGSVGTYNSVKRVTSLGFTTSKTKHEPVGTGIKDSQFSFLLSEDPFSGFHGRSSTSLNSIGVSVVIKTREAVGPWPNDESGGEWDYVPKSEISHIYISYDDDFIHTLKFACKDASGKLLEESPTFGAKTDGSKHREIVIDTNVHKLGGIRGAYGPSGGEILLKSLSFVINKWKSFGPFSIEKDMDESFSYMVQGEEVVTGFHGRAGSVIESIGVYIRPSKTSILVGPLNFYDSGTTWTYKPEGLISRIILSHNSYVRNLQFESIDEKGIKHTSKVFGNEASNAQENTNIDIDKDDKLTNISGALISNAYVSQLCFSTEKRDVYGPFDTQGFKAPTAFSIPVKDGYISGFLGKFLDYHVAIGVFVKPT